MTDQATAPSSTVMVGVDVGGTFTDAVVVADGRLVTAKVPTTPDDQSLGVVASVLTALAQSGVRAADVDRFAHGMTVGTNALLEGTGAPIALAAAKLFGAPELGWIAVLLLLADVALNRWSAGEAEDSPGNDVLVHLGRSAGDGV